ncbi:transmembrane protein 41A-A-like [Tropilaelaps mercedesae]|uniref:Transmembrane protein 41A-A-like n=1 Tax=Tropilaelaps mercedesae TaxID=418985 RepID=A0A1V9Y2W6_9ACAR|nr:transmembrane protein 41A-A-like [Tropilaelaps mercedesae]
MPSMRVLLIPLCFVAASAWLYILSKSAPKLQRSDNDTSTLKFPSSFEELHELSALLQEYYSSHPNFVYVLFCSAYLYKQTFAIPGSVFMNLLGGALFGVIPGFLLACLLSATGATFCYLLSYACGRQLLRKFFASKISHFEDKIDENRDDLIYVLLFLRLFPITPNWFLNMASPIVGIPMHLFFISVFIGLMPYNLMCVQAGSLLSEIESTSDVLTPSVAVKMALLAMAALMPAFFRKIHNNRRLSRPSTKRVPSDLTEIKNHTE